MTYRLKFQLKVEAHQTHTYLETHALLVVVFALLGNILECPVEVGHLGGIVVAQNWALRLPHFSALMIQESVCVVSSGVPIKISSRRNVWEKTEMVSSLTGRAT